MSRESLLYGDEGYAEPGQEEKIPGGPYVHTDVNAIVLLERPDLASIDIRIGKILSDSLHGIIR